MRSRIVLGAEEFGFEIEGEGPALVLLHSLGTSTWLWQSSFRHWRSRFTVIAIDCRGHGRSTCRTGTSMERCARDVLGLLDALGVKQAAVLGLSMGGVIAARLHELAPARVRALVLADTFCHMPWGEERIALIERKLAQMPMDVFAEKYAQQTLLEGAPAPSSAQLAACVAAVSKSAYLHTARSLFTQDTRRSLARVKVPTLVLVGAQDDRTPISMAQEIVDTVPHAQLAVVPVAAHLSNLDNPAGFHDAVDRFLSTTCARWHPTS
jgi:pimeloyl-ACP methyl ester carboxylesterase